MSKSFCQFDGPPCFRHSNYVFYKAFKYKCDYQIRVLTLGDFFFLKILQEIPICIGEVELLWEDKASNQLFSSLKLYFRPEHTPNGRQDDTGEDEVIALGERLILRLDDLAPLIQQAVKWTYGCPTYSTRTVKADTGPDGCENGMTQLKSGGHRAGLRNGVVVSDEHAQTRNLPLGPPESDSLVSRQDTSTGAANLAVMSYPKYCRYRAVRRRLEGCDSEWLHLAVVMAIGGFSGRTTGCRVMFCRDTFYQAEIDDLDIRMDYMLPVLKNSNKGKKSRQLTRKDSQHDSDSMEVVFASVAPSVSASSRPRRLTESTETREEKGSTAEQAFLIGLHKFMHDIKMPIDKIPSLGYRQIDLYYFYRQAERLGGYDSVTHKRMWKYLYDKLGGDSNNSNAASCTRKHYERLLLHYERHLRKLKAGKAKTRTHKQEDLQNGDTNPEKDNTAQVKKQDVNIGPESGHTEKIGEQDNKENLRQKLSESSRNCKQDDTPNCQRENSSFEEKPVPDVTKPVPNVTKPVPNVMKTVSTVVKPSSTVIKSVPTLTEHSIADVKVESDLLETALVRHRAKSGGSPVSKQHPSVPQTESSALPHAGTTYTGGCLVGPHHMLQTTWKGKSAPTSGIAPPAKANENELLAGSHLRGLPNTALSFKRCQDSIVDDENQPSRNMSSQMPSGNSAQQPYRPLPYLAPSNHDQPARKTSHSSSHPHPYGSSSHQLASVLHPKPPGHRSQLNLPPAPSTIYLHPSSTSPLSAIQTSTASSPPSAHCHPRKRSYPFDCPAGPSTGPFPSPDLVLDRIRNCTGLPRSNAHLAHPVIIQQRFDDPRQIFQQAPQTANPSVSLPPKREPRFHRELPSNKPKNSKSHQPRGQHSHGPSPELEQALRQRRSLNKSQGVDQTPTGTSAHFNGAHSSRRNRQSVPPASPVPSSSKDVRLTSALFGSQFTALPRAGRPPDHTPALMEDSAAAPMVIGPHLHPAFMSSYLPAASVSPQLLSSSFSSPAQLSSSFPSPAQLASTFPSPAQLAAYEEMFRHNGRGPFLAFSGKLSKKS